LLLFLGRKVSVDVLPRVGAALKNFIAPITASSRQDQIKTKDERPFQRHKQQQKKEEQKKEKPKLQVVKPIAPATKIQPTTEDEAPPGLKTVNTDKTESNASVAEAFLALLELLQESKSSLVSWLGNQYYSVAAKKQKKAGKLKKGTMFDEKVE